MSALGIIGLGAIGYPIAKRLVSAGYDVYTTVHSEKSRKRAEELNLHILESPACFSKYVDVVIVLVSNYEQCHHCLNGDDGVFTTMRNGIIILSSTVSYQNAQELAKTCPSKVALLDAPLSGGVVGAEDGTLVCMVAGKESAYRACNNLFSAYCKNTVYVDEQIGDAQKIKMINQMLVGIHIVATAEAKSLASACGIPLDRVYDVISLCAGNSAIFQTRMPKLIQKDFEVKASLETFEKDTKICIDIAREVESPCFLTKLCHDLYKNTPRSNLIPEDACAVIRMYEKLDQEAK